MSISRPGSVGLGAAQTVFAALAQDYLACKGLIDAGDSGRMIALVGDAELDEGNVFEALLESWKHDVRNLWWVVDYNRQSLDSVVSDRLFGRIDELFRSVGWRVLTLKYGRLLEAAFAEPGGAALKAWIDNCPNSLYSALTYKGGAGWRERLTGDIGDEVHALLARRDDGALHALMTNLAGNDLDMLLEAFHGIDDDRPTCLICYTTKGYGLPFAGHKDNHGRADDARPDGDLSRRNGRRPGGGVGPLRRAGHSGRGAGGVSRPGALRRRLSQAALRRPGSRCRNASSRRTGRRSPPRTGSGGS